MNQALPPIPISRAQRWRIFRQQTLPLIVFGVSVLLVALVWDRAVSPSGFVAELEKVQVAVGSPVAGVVTDLQTDTLQAVSAGSVVAYLRPASPAVLDASLALIRAEVETLRTSLEPALGSQRVALESDRLRLDFLRERVNLASLKADQLNAETNCARLEMLRSRDVVSEQSYTSAKNTRDGLLLKIAEQTALLEKMQQAVADYEGLFSNNAMRTGDRVLEASLKIQEERLRLTEAQLGPTALRAPMNGLVSAVLKRSGEAVKAGDPILTITAAQSVRIVGYIRQPVALHPKPGMKVQLRSRANRGMVADSTIEQVGASLEPVALTLLPPNARTDGTELGLRVHVFLPDNFHAMPGEAVDVILLSDQS